MRWCPVGLCHEREPMVESERAREYDLDQIFQDRARVLFELSNLRYPYGQMCSTAQREQKGKVETGYAVLAGNERGAGFADAQLSRTLA